MKIGFFDSGLGGITILSAVRELIPEYDYLYFGDTANLPYGDRTEEEIHALTYAGIKRLFDSGALLVIVACNTASVSSVRKYQDEMLAVEYPGRKVLGVIIPTVETLLDSGASSVLLIGTERTIQSDKYAIELKKSEVSLTLHTRATPRLVPLIEAGEHNLACEYALQVVGEVAHHVDTVVLGCTHYTLIKECLRRTHPSHTIISQDEIIPYKLKDYLIRHPEIEGQLTREGSVEVDLSAESPTYKKIMENLCSQYQTPLP